MSGGSRGTDDDPPGRRARGDFSAADSLMGNG